MNSRHASTVVLAALVLALAACGGQTGTDAAPTITVAPTTPDGVAAAFAAAYAAGDTPTACTLAVGSALQRMTSKGECANTQWPAVQYWSGRTCQFGVDPSIGDDSGVRLFQFHTSGQVDGVADFLVGVNGAGNSWRVTQLWADVGATASMCALADQIRPSS